MQEFVIAAILVAISVVSSQISFSPVMIECIPWSLGCAALGFISSMVTSVGYHLSLWHALKPKGLLPAGWYWRPTHLHAILSSEHRFTVLCWFYAGATSFILVLFGAGFTLWGLYQMGPS